MLNITEILTESPLWLPIAVLFLWFRFIIRTAKFIGISKWFILFGYIFVPFNTKLIPYLAVVELVLWIGNILFPIQKLVQQQQ